MLHEQEADVFGIADLTKSNKLCPYKQSYCYFM